MVGKLLSSPEKSTDIALSVAQLSSRQGANSLPSYESNEI